MPAPPIPADSPPAGLTGRAVRLLRRGRRSRLVDLAARAGVSVASLSAFGRGPHRPHLFPHLRT